VQPSALVEIAESEGYAESHRVARYTDVKQVQKVEPGVRPRPRNA
jgi:hypothetical protein